MFVRWIVILVLTASAALAGAACWGYTSVSAGSASAASCVAVDFADTATAQNAAQASVQIASASVGSASISAQPAHVSASVQDGFAAVPAATAQVVPVVQPSSTKVQILKKIGDKIAKSTKIECDFDEEIIAKLEKDNKKRQGKFYLFVPKDSMAIMYTTGDYMKLGKYGVHFKDKKKQYDISSERKKIYGFFYNFLNLCFRLDKKEVYANYNLQVSERETTYQIQITPKKDLEKKFLKEINIVVSKSDLSFDKLSIVGAKSTMNYVFRNKKYSFS